MDLPTTAVLTGLALVAAAAAGWLGARPAAPAKPPRLVPWRLLMGAACVIALALLVHIVALLRDG